MTALSAFTPRQGHDDAWVALPWNSAFTLTMPSDGRHTIVPQRPWIIMAASTSLKTPASMRRTLPAPPSSAGVPMTWMRPGKGSGRSAAASAAPAPTPEVAMTLWPQACPILGSASYSAMMAMVGPGPWPPMVARKAVGSPPTPRSTWAPCASRNAVSQAAAFSSLKPSSGFSWMRWLSRSRSSASRSTASAILLLAASRVSFVAAMPLSSRLSAGRGAPSSGLGSGWLTVDGPLEGVGRAPVAGPPALPEQGDDLPPRLHGPVLGELELGPDGRHLEPHRGQLAEGAAIERVLHAQRPVATLGLMLGEEAHLLRQHLRGVLGHGGPALEDRRAVIGRGGSGVFRVHPVGRDHGQDLVHLEEAARPRLEVRDLLVGPHQVELQGDPIVHEVVEPEMGRAVLAHGDEAPHLLRLHEAIDVVPGDVGVVVVEDHRRANSSLAAWTLAGSASRSSAVMAMVFAAASMPARARGVTAAAAK